MPQTSVLDYLNRARSIPAAIPAFDAFDAHSAEGILTAFEAAGSPGLIAVYDKTMDDTNVDALVAYIRRRAADLQVPVSIILDHGRDLRQCRQAIDLGFDAVMFDGSSLPYEENLRQTAEIAAVARSAGVFMEAELGHVGDAASYPDDPEGLTDPQSAIGFVADTGVDLLAVAIGTAHGVYRTTPNLQLNLLRQLAAALTVPLVLHGGTGLSDAQFRSAIADGIAKINVSTDLYLSAANAIRAAHEAGEPSYLELGAIAEKTVATRCAHFLSVFATHELI
jgi:ketose-bisphosphate aldolase